MTLRYATIVALVILLRLAPTCFSTVWKTGGYVDSCSDTTVITSLPFTSPAGTTDKCYCLSGSKLTSASTGINFHRNTSILVTSRGAATDTIISKGGALIFSNYAYWIRVKNMTVEPDSTTNYVSTTSAAIAHGLWFDHCNMKAKRRNGHIFKGEQFYELFVDGGTYASEVDSFTSRCYHDGAAFLCPANAGYFDQGDFFIKFRDVHVTKAPHAIIATQGYKDPYVEVVNCSLVVDGRNDLYNYPYTDICKNSGDNFAIDIGGAGRGSRIDSNYFGAGTSSEGGQGVLIQCTDSLFVRGNTFELHEGPNEVHAGGKGAAIYFRYVPDGSPTYTGNQNVYIQNNNVHATIDCDTNTTYRGREFEAFSMILSADGYDVVDSMWNIHIENNHVVVDTVGAMSGFNQAIALGFGSVDTNKVGYSMSGYRVFENNYWSSPQGAVRMGNTRGTPANDLLMIGDTINSLANHGDSSGVIFNKTGTYRQHSRRNVLRDVVWTGFAADNKVKFSTVNVVDNDSLGLSLLYQRTVNLLVWNLGSQPVETCTLGVRNAYGQLVDTGYTAANGFFSTVASYKFDVEDLFPADGYVLSDSTGYNPLTITARKGEYSASVELTLSATVCCDTIVLNAPAVSGNKLMVNQ